MRVTPKDVIIDEVIRDLQNFDLSVASEKQRYSVRENIRFFEASRSLPKYVKWLFVEAPHIDSKQILEINDFPFGRWDRSMHLSLMALERKAFPGIIQPLVDGIARFANSQNGHIIIANLGCGGMEVEKQVMTKLFKQEHPPQITFIGIDKSPVMHEIAKKNLSELGDRVEITEVEKLDNTALKKLDAPLAGRHHVILCYDDVLNLDTYFQPKTFDLIFSSLFKHHLTNAEKDAIDNISMKLAKNVFEYDGYKHWLFTAIPHTITAWNDPIFLNATILSDLRYDTKSTLRETLKTGWEISFSKVATYLKRYAG